MGGGATTGAWIAGMGGGATTGAWIAGIGGGATTGAWIAGIGGGATTSTLGRARAAIVTSSGSTDHVARRS
jgi:hypothetical protein